MVGPSRHSATRAPLRLLGVASLAVLAALGGCVGVLGGSSGDREDHAALDGRGLGGTARAGGFGAGAGGERDIEMGGAGGSGSAGAAGGAAGSGGTAEPTGGSGGAPILCQVSGTKDCSDSPNIVCDGVGSNGNFDAQVGDAVKYVRDLPANAGWFDYDGQPACCPIVGTGTQADKVMFRDAVLERLETHANLCAEADPGNHPHEITVKLNNSCIEGFIVVTSQGVVRNPPKHSYNCVEQ